MLKEKNVRNLSRNKFFAFATALAIGSFVVIGGTSALGDTVDSAESNAYGVQLLGPVPIDAMPSVSATIESGRTTDTLVEIPADPLATSFTASVTADAERESVLESVLQGVMETADASVPNEWNATGHAVTEDLQAVTDLVMADVVESESVAACEGNTTTFGSAARIVNLVVSGTSIVLPEPAPNQVLVDQAGIRVIFWETNWDPATGGTTDGSSTVFTNGIHVTAPLGIDLIVSHSEATAACAAAQPPADDNECEDGVDNDDPEDTLADADDPGCHTDGDPNNASSYDPDDDNESDDGNAPPAPVVDGDPNFTG